MFLDFWYLFCLCLCVVWVLAKHGVMGVQKFNQNQKIWAKRNSNKKKASAQWFKAKACSLEHIAFTCTLRKRGSESGGVHRAENYEHENTSASPKSHKKQVPNAKVRFMQGKVNFHKTTAFKNWPREKNKHWNINWDWNWIPQYS